MHSTPRFLQGVFAFEGKGLDQPAPLGAALNLFQPGFEPDGSGSASGDRSARPRHVEKGSLSWTVPAGASAQAVYFRGGNASNELICVVLVRDGAPMRYFPVGAKSDVHVPLRVLEDLAGGTTVELWLAAPAGLAGTVIVDLGLVEI